MSHRKIKKFNDRGYERLFNLVENAVSQLISLIVSKIKFEQNGESLKFPTIEIIL